MLRLLVHSPMHHTQFAESLSEVKSTEALSSSQALTTMTLPWEQLSEGRHSPAHTDGWVQALGISTLDFRCLK